MTNTNMTGIFIPIEILKDSNLSINEKLILSLVKNMKSLYMSNQSLADLLGISKSRVSHIITSLNQKGYIDVTLTYREDKQVDKRTVTLKKAVEVVQEAVKRAVSKAKEIKQAYTTTKTTVGTQEVEQVTFGQSMYKKTSTYKKTDKRARFNNICSHNWDFNELERLEQQYIEERASEFDFEDVKRRLAHIRGEV